MKKFKLPEFCKKYFWDVNFEELSEKHLFFIIERILCFGNELSINWLLKNIKINNIKKVIKNSRNLDPKTRNYWNIILR